MSNDSGIKTSELGVQQFPEGQHPRTLRKQGKTVKPEFKAAFDAWVKEQDERTQKLLKSNPSKLANIFRSALNVVNQEDFEKMLGLDVTDDTEDESVAANTGTGVASAEKVDKTKKNK